MTSSSSGYLAASDNLTSSDPYYLRRTIPVPDSHVVMLTFRYLGKPRATVWLDPPYRRYDHSRGQFGDNVTLLDMLYDGQVRFYHTAQLSVTAVRDTCINTACFRLSFSFFPESGRPQQLLSGSWNCSAADYPGFQQHLACNVQVECEDGRDETEHCPFSSPGCQGLVALCGRCYKLVTTLRGFHTKTADANKRANEFCGQFGANLGIPKCVYNWREAIMHATKGVRLIQPFLWLGISTKDPSLPNMYRYALVSEDSTVLYHSVKVTIRGGVNRKMCFLQSGLIIRGTWCVDQLLDNGAVCEGEKYKTYESSNRSDVISLVRTHFGLKTQQLEFTVCSSGHVVHTFLLCGSQQYLVCGQQHGSPCTFLNYTLHTSDRPDPRDSQGHAVPIFICHDKTTTMPHTLVCDFRTDCQDKSDESFCHHPRCVQTFTCSNGQCLPFRRLCDFIAHCMDDSDESTCSGVQRDFIADRPYFPSPALISFDGARTFVSTPMSSNDSCPPSHYRCPGELNDCLPAYTRCNGMYDCVHHQDEEGCAHATCPGLFKCRASAICVHGSHVCDDWPHCPMHDDELVCGVTCPVGCLCAGHSFLCRRPFPAALFPQLRSLEATHSGMTLSDVRHNVYLIHLVLARCSLALLPVVELLNVRFLDLRGNRLQLVNLTSFLALTNLRALSLSQNPLVSLRTDDSDTQQTALTWIDLSFATLIAFDSKILSQFPQVRKLNLSFTSVHTINPGGFKFIPQLTELYLDGSPVKLFPADIFRGLSHLRVLSSHNYKLCCSHILPPDLDDLSCHAPKDEISSCDDLLQSGIYRGILWCISCLCLSGNMFCFLARVYAQKMTSPSGFTVFVINLTVADFLMGVYIVIIGTADERFRGKYLHYDDAWTDSAACKVAGFLSLVSSEVSALFICLITLDRFVVLRYPFSTLRFERKSSTVACALTWLTGLSLALLPLLPVTSHWEFYSQTGICIPLPVTRREFKGRAYSFGLVIVLNFVLFLLISCGQAFIYWSVQSNTMKTCSGRESRDMTIARRLISVALTDFMCWFPIGLCGILASVGTPIPGEVNVSLAIFVLPLNSAINPFVYTFNTLVEKRQKANEAKFLKWLENHNDVIDVK